MLMLIYVRNNNLWRLNISNSDLDLHINYLHFWIVKNVFNITVFIAFHICSVLIKICSFFYISISKSLCKVMWYHRTIVCTYFIEIDTIIKTHNTSFFFLLNNLFTFSDLPIFIFYPTITNTLVGNKSTNSNLISSFLTFLSFSW